MLSHVSSLRLSSGYSGLVRTLSMQPVPPCSAPAHWWRQQASGLLLHWELWLGGILCVCVCVCVCFLIMLPSEIPKLPTDPPVREFPGVWKLLHNSFPRTGLHPLFCLLYFVLPPFKENGLAFWVPGVLHQCSKVVSWKLFSIQMIFQ